MTEETTGMRADEVIDQAAEVYNHPSGLADGEWERCRNSTESEWIVAALLAAVGDGPAVLTPEGELMGLEVAPVPYNSHLLWPIPEGPLYRLVPLTDDRTGGPSSG